MFWTKTKPIYTIVFANGITASYDLSEIQFIGQDEGGGIKLWYRNGAVVLECGKWNRAAIDDLHIHFREQRGNTYHKQYADS